MPKKSEVATICFIKDISTSVEKVSHDIKILATNGKVKANRCLLQMASPIIRRNLEYNEKADVLDLQDYSVETVKSLLKLIYVGKLSCQSNEVKEEGLDEDLEVKTSVSLPDKPEKVKVKNEFPNLSPIPLEENCKDKERFLMLEQYIGLNNDTGLEQCKVCSKSYKGASRSTRLRKIFDHVERLHLKLRSYACDYCSHTFNSKGQKASHVSLKHQSEKCSDKKVKKPLKLAILKKSEREPAKPAEQ